MSQNKALPPHIAAKLMQAMQKAGAVSSMKIDGTSMEPFIMNGEKILVDNRLRDFEPGDIVHFEREGEAGTFLHRIVAIEGDRVITKGDNRYSFDIPVKKENIKGKVTTIERVDGSKVFLKDEPWKSFCRMMAQVSFRMGVFHSEMMKEKAEGPADEIHKKAFDLYHSGKQEEALDLFRQAAALDPARALSRVDMGEILRQQGKGHEAILHLRLALDIDRRGSEASAQAYNIIGNTLCDMGRYEESLEEYLSSIDVSPEFVPPYINRGWAYFKLGHPEKAEADYKKALELEPDNYKAVKNLALLHFSQKRMDQAREYMEKALGINDRDPDIYNNLGLVYLENGNMDKAEELIKKALEMNPEHREALCNLGTVLEKRGDKKAALGHYAKALKKLGGDGDIQASISRIMNDEN